jgi:rhamnulokinase
VKRVTYDALLNVCKELAQQPLLAQGPGANVSIKLSPTDMRIKASGFSFNEITAESGLVSVDPQKIKAFYEKISLEKLPDEDIAAFHLLDGAPRPSMETGFHAFLDRVVIHTHPVQTNIIACLQNGERIARELYGEHVQWVPYVTPGHPLAKEMFKLVKTLQLAGRIPHAYMLQNHGLIVTGPSVDFCWAWHQRIIEQAEKYLQEKIAMIPSWPIVSFVYENGFWMTTNPAFSTIVEHPLRAQELVTNHPFPDSVVFLDTATLAPTLKDLAVTKASVGFVKGKGLAYALSEKRAREFEDVVTASFLIREFGSRIGTMKYLNAHETNAIRNSAFEKHRQQVQK